MLITDVDPQILLRAYENPKLQAKAINWVANIKGFERFDDEAFLTQAVATAKSAMKDIPFDEVVVDGESENNPSAILMVVALSMVKLGLIPSYEK